MSYLSERDEALKIMLRSAARHGVSAIDVLAHRRNAATVRARFSAILAVKARFPHWSLPQMGRLFNRDHTTILHALRTAPALGLGVSAVPKQPAPVPSITASLQFCQEPSDDRSQDDQVCLPSCEEHRSTKGFSSVQKEFAGEKAAFAGASNV